MNSSQKDAFKKAIKASFGAWKNHTEDTEKFIRSLRENNRMRWLNEAKD